MTLPQAVPILDAEVPAASRRKRTFRMYERGQALKHNQCYLGFDERFELEVVKEILAIEDEEDALELAGHEAWRQVQLEMREADALRVGRLHPDKGPWKRWKMPPDRPSTLLTLTQMQDEARKDARLRELQENHERLRQEAAERAEALFEQAEAEQQERIRLHLEASRRAKEAHKAREKKKALQLVDATVQRARERAAQDAAEVADMLAQAQAEQRAWERQRRERAARLQREDAEFNSPRGRP